MSSPSILDEVILGYRKVVEDRYQYDDLKTQYELPDSFGEDKVNQFRTYFLEYIYPHPDKRAELNEAFDQLDNYIKQPQKLVRLVLDSAFLLFKYGRHLRSILGAGMKALRSYRSATRFENRLAKIAQRSGVIPPFTNVQINQFISKLPKSDIDQFVENSQSLFETLHDRSLIKKIQEIVDHLISKMRKRPNVYGPSEVKGLEIGRDIIVHGDALFDELSKEEQSRLLETVLRIEKDTLDRLFA